MPFQEKSDTFTYIDASKATPDDRLKVTFENGMELYCKKQFTKSYSSDNHLDVDLDLTTPAIISALYEKILENERYQESHRLPFMRRRWTLEDIRSKAHLYISVEKSVFDQSPRVGSVMKVWGVMPPGGGMYAVADGSPVATVESLTLN